MTSASRSLLATLLLTPMFLVTGAASASAQAELALTVDNANDTGPGSYRQAIADASASAGSDVITFTGVFDITLQSDVDLTGFAAVTIEGNGSTIDGANSHQILDATAPVTVRNLNLTAGMAPGGAGGGAIRSTSNVTVENSTLSNNSAPTGNGGSIQGVDVTVSDTVFTDILTLNNAEYGGFVDGTNVDLVDSQMSGGRADRGGAINGDDVDITGSTLTDNRSEQIGGAVLADNDVTVVDSTVSDNTSANTGGAIDGPAVTVTGSTISDNRALGGGGGAIRSQSTGTAPSVTLTNSVLQRNTAFQNGGAIDIGTACCNSTVAVIDSVISDGSGQFGGGIFASSNAQTTVTVLDSSLYNNGGTTGGAIFAGSNGGVPEVTITNSTVAGNSAQSGAAIAMFDGTVELIHATLAENTTTSGSHVQTPNLVATASVLAESVGPGDQCTVSNATTAHEYNYDDDGTCGFGAADGNVSGGDPPLLGQARNNGDLVAATESTEAGGNGTPRPSMFPLNGSPLIDAIPPIDCPDAPELDLDQRGLDRPFGVGCDIGAIEAVFPAHDRTDVTNFYEATVRWITSTVNTPQILNGFGDGTFGQTLNITRGQVARMYYRAAGQPDVSGYPAHGFTDVIPFYEDAVKWAKAEGIFDGFMSDNTFRHGIPISRGNYTRSLFGFAGSPDITGLPAHGFGDVTNFYNEAVTWAKANGVADGFAVDNTFRQANNINRGNASRIMYGLARTKPAWNDTMSAPDNMLFRPNLPA